MDALQFAHRVIYSIAHIGMIMVFSVWGMLLLLYSFIRDILFLVEGESLPKRVVIVGGGFAGALAAKSLQHYCKLTLVDTKDYFEFTPSVLRTLVEPERASTIQVNHNSYLDPRNVTLIQAHRVKRIINTQELELENSERLQFDYLLLCSGSTYNSPFKESHNVIRQWRGNTLIQHHSQLKEAQRVLVIGGGLVGVELAAEIAWKFPEKQLILAHGDQRLLSRSNVPEKAVKYATDFFKQLPNVELLLNEYVTSQRDPTHFVTKSNRVIEADLVFVCTGILPNSQLLRCGELENSVDSHGYAKVNRYLQLEGTTNILVAGDLSNILEEKLAQNAESQASLVSHNLLELMKNGKRAKLREYDSWDRAKLISLGKYDGILTYKGFAFSGIIPAIMKEAVEWKVLIAYKFLVWKNYFHS